MRTGAHELIGSIIMSDENELEVLRRKNQLLTRALQEAEERLNVLGKLHEENRMLLLDYPVRPRVRFGWEQPPLQPMVEYFDSRKEAFLSYAARLEVMLPLLMEISVTEQSPLEPYWSNMFLGPSDAAMLCTFLAVHKPQTYIEIGSGNSTMYARWLIDRMKLPTRIISIDPVPRAGIDTLCDEVIRKPLEEQDLDIFSSLRADDIVFFDGSHRALQNSDVTVFFLELLPRLVSGVHWHIHDIFLPQDYPASWAERHYNEQYLLAAALLAGPSRYKVSFACSYMQQGEWLKQAMANVANHPHLSPIAEGGGSVWLQMS